MRYTIRKLKPRLNSGRNKMFQKKVRESIQLHGIVLEGEIDIDGLAEYFFCSTPTVQRFKNLGIIKPKGRSKHKLVYDKRESIERLSPYTVEGRLTQNKEILKHLIKADEHIK